jgi:hypothetical protein
MNAKQSPGEAMIDEASPVVTRPAKPKRTMESIRIERQYRNVVRLFLAGELPNFVHARHVDVANILHNLPFGRELMHLGLQTMAYRNFVPDKYSREITDFYWDQLDGTLPDPERFADLPGGAAGEPCNAAPGDRA